MSAEKVLATKKTVMDTTIIRTSGNPASTKKQQQQGKERDVAERTKHPGHAIKRTTTGKGRPRQ